MNGRNHPRPTGVRRPARRLILFTLALALAGCAGGGGGTDVGALTGPTVEVPVAPTTSGSDASRSGASGSGATGVGRRPGRDRALGPDGAPDRSR
jgi:hypothetical protein